jgi:hypothetical protein
LDAGGEVVTDLVLEVGGELVTEECRHLLGLDDMHGGTHDGGVERLELTLVRQNTTSVANFACMRLRW